MFTGYKSISGNVSEVARNYFPDLPYLSGKTLVRVSGYRGNLEAITEYDQWLQQSHDLFLINGYRVLDMFYWEERIANLVSRSMTIAHAMDRNIFPIFNCHHLLNTLLSVDGDQRNHQYNVLYIKIIKHLWPEVLQEPINPSIKKILIREMERLGVYSLYNKGRMLLSKME